MRPIGTILKEWRSSAGQRQEDLEKASGVSQEYISALETGRIKRPGAYQVRALVRALGRTMDDLFTAAEDTAAWLPPRVAA